MRKCKECGTSIRYLDLCNDCSWNAMRDRVSRRIEIEQYKKENNIDKLPRNYPSTKWAKKTIKEKRRGEIENVSDYYVKQLIAQKMSIPFKDVPEEVIPDYRALVKLKREIKNHKK